MARYKIYWSSGLGESTQVVDADDLQEAEQMAYEEYRDECESSANYGAQLATEDDEEEYA